jgi:long-chain acyl-CoA synthetase
MKRQTVTQRFLASVERAEARVFLECEGRSWRYAEVCERAAAVARALRDSGVNPGDRVALVMRNGLAYVAGYYGVLFAGACVVTGDPETHVDMLHHLLIDSGAVAAVLGSEALQRLHSANRVPPLRLLLTNAPSDRPGATRIDDLPSAPLDPQPTAKDDLAQIIYTSGTTGRPKGVTLTHRCLVANTDGIVEGLRLQDGDSVFVILPFSYSYGNSLLQTHADVAGRLVLAPDFVFLSRVTSLLESSRVHGFAGVPSSYLALLNHTDFAGRPFADLRYVTCAGGALPLPTVRLLRTKLPHVQLFLMYGQTEASARISILPPEEVDRRSDSAGLPLRGVSLAVLRADGTPAPHGEAGEIVVRGDNVMVGYWNDRAATAEVLKPQGLLTGDRGRLDDEGYLYIVGRRTDIIKCGGHRVGPQEVENTLLQHPAVAEVGVIGRSDPQLGEVPVAFVVARAGTSLQPADLIAFAKDRLPRYSAVRDVFLVDALPRTTNGKLQRARLREMLPERE